MKGIGKPSGDEDQVCVRREAKEFLTMPYCAVLCHAVLCVTVHNLLAWILLNEKRGITIRRYLHEYGEM